MTSSHRATQGKGVMPDGTSRFSYDGKTLYHFMGTSTFSEFTVLPEIALAKVSILCITFTTYCIERFIMCKILAV